MTVAQSCPTLCDPTEFSRPEYWSGLPCPPPGDHPNPGIHSRYPALQADSLLTESPGKPNTVEVTNIFKGLDVVDSVPEELWTEVCNTVQEVGPIPFQRKRKARRQSDWLRRLYK